MRIPKIKRSYIFIALGIIALAAAGHYCFTLRLQRAYTVPDTLPEMTNVAQRVFEAKCNLCHDIHDGLPWQARLPVVGALFQKDVIPAVRHFDTSEDLTVHLGRMNKLFRILDDGTMPPLRFRVAHWNTALSASDKALFTAYAIAARKAWMDKLDIPGDPKKTIQILPSSISYSHTQAMLGKALFNDKRLSTDNTVACATCHILREGGDDNRRYSLGVGQASGDVNAPTVYNAVFNMVQFWDGRAATLEAQAGGPPLNPIEMACKSFDEIIARLNADVVFSNAFVRIYTNGITEASICHAIAQFERTLLTADNVFDRAQWGRRPLREQPQRGFDAFTRRRCDTCHCGPALGGLSYEHIDLKADYFAGRPMTAGDYGRFNVTKNPLDKHRFKVPNLRHVMFTAPYLHDGTIKTLPEAVDVMMRCVVGATPAAGETADIAAFLETL